MAIRNAIGAPKKRGPVMNGRYALQKDWRKSRLIRIKNPTKRKLYLKVYTKAGSYTAYGACEINGKRYPDPHTRQEVFFKRGDYESLYLTESEARTLNSAPGQDYVIVATPIGEVLNGLRINTAGFVIEATEEPQGKLFSTILLGGQEEENSHGR